jgi:hypothetical protein
MFKSKWRKKYEVAMNVIEYWMKLEERTAKFYANNNNRSMFDIHMAKQLSLTEALDHMKNIKKMTNLQLKMSKYLD